MHIIARQAPNKNKEISKNRMIHATELFLLLYKYNYYTIYFVVLLVNIYYKRTKES